MKPHSVIVYGPMGCGKTTNSATLMHISEMSHVSDDWQPGQPIRRGHLHLTSATFGEIEGIGTGVSVVSFDSVMGHMRAEMNHIALATSIHADNVAAGWWTDIVTGERLERNKAEMLMLTVSEVSEASAGFFSGENDDHLPEHPMFDVELGDICIRLYDQIGAMIAAGHQVKQCSAPVVDKDDVDAALLQVVNCLSEAMEHVRKNRLQEYTDSLCEALMATYAIAEDYEVDLSAIIQMKRAYNAKRLDHKREARLANGGKAF